jgi:uncharacterized SAM-binding protein YcdF (DUF218 family)
MFLFKFIWRFITFLFLVALVVPTWAVARTWYVANNETIRKADAIVVMGAAQLDGRPGEVLTARLKETARIYKNNFAPHIYTLGSGAPGDRFTEAGSGRSWLIRNGVSHNAITAVPQGRDTFTSIQSFASVAKKSKIKDIIIVTDPYHCLRSKTMTEDEGFTATCSPTRVGIASLEKAGFRYLLREAGAYLAYVTLGRRGIHISDHVA